jgi:hypothetical protein
MLAQAFQSMVSITRGRSAMERLMNSVKDKATAQLDTT